MLYSDKRNLLDLYNALNNSSHTDIDNLTVTTLKGGTYMKYKNDASFVFSYELYMFEQQSSINFNMPLRFFHYGSEVYRDMFPNNVLHRKSMLKIPTPHFITFYNGKEKMKERVKILRLSDMFEQKTDNPELELIVTVININPEYESDNDSRTDKEEPIIGDESKDVFVKNALANADILNRCKSLRDYMTFVNKVRNKTDMYGMDVKEAVTEAVDAKKFGIEKWWLILIIALLVSIVGIILMVIPFAAQTMAAWIIGINLVLDGVLNICVVLSTVKTIRTKKSA
mgnify:CR=1 FL=1